MHKLALFAALPLLAACVTPTEPAPDLPLSSWTFVSIDGAAPVSDKARLDMLADRISASVGCNGMGGSLTVKPGRLVIGPVMSTQMYCDGLMEQECAVADLLAASPRFFVEGGRMAIVSDDHKAELVRASD